MSRRVWLLLCLSWLGCASTTSPDPTTTSSGGSTAAGGAGGSGGSTSSSSSTSSSGLGGDFDAGNFTPLPVKDLPLDSITFWERTGGTEPTPYTFAIDGPELTVRLEDPLSTGNHDIPGASTEFYDVYYSDENGGFVLEGSYLTISGVFEHPLPAGGGLNLAEIGLNWSDATTEFGNYVASFVTLGDNAHPETVENCIDGDLQTHTTMGNTVGSAERLRLTLGFESTSGPPPR